nr:hypothetical protein GCM10020185_26690 [Pseudomonas brassicacearum subsp. brassicacearum]
MRLFQTARRFNMEVQPQLVLLQKTLLNIEGLGRQLYPELDLWNTAQPFLERWMRERVSPKTLLGNVQSQFEQLPHLANMTRDLLERMSQPHAHDPAPPVAPTQGRLAVAPAGRRSPGRRRSAGDRRAAEPTGSLASRYHDGGRSVSGRSPIASTGSHWHTVSTLGPPTSGARPMVGVKDEKNWQDEIKWDADGLVPAIAQDHKTGRVLMMAWMNREALALTAAENRAIYWSRSRGKLWRKGEESGHVQHLHEMRLDCDGDVIILMVEQVGEIACHTGRQSCFYRVFENGDWKTVDPVLKDPHAIYSGHTHE